MLAPAHRHACGTGSHVAEDGVTDNLAHVFGQTPVHSEGINLPQLGLDAMDGRGER